MRLLKIIPETVCPGRRFIYINIFKRRFTAFVRGPVVPRGVGLAGEV